MPCSVTLSATELAERIRRRELSPVAVVRAFLDRIAAVDGELGAYCTVTAEQALDEARAAEAALAGGAPTGPLHGVPVSIKDLVFTRGVRTTRGSAIYADLVPDEDAPVVERLRAAGAISLGKTNTPEFGWKGLTDNRLFPPTRNPWDRTRTAGGSSGGAAAAVAAGLGPIGIGSDGGGSVRIPGSFCGVVGLKPSFGRIPYYPASAAETLSHMGPLTRTVADAALALDVLAGPDERDRLTLPVPHAPEGSYLAAAEAGAREGLAGLRVGWSQTLGYAAVDGEVAALTSAAVEQLADGRRERRDAGAGLDRSRGTVVGALLRGDRGGAGGLSARVARADGPGAGRHRGAGQGVDGVRLYAGRLSAGRVLASGAALF